MVSPVRRMWRVMAAERRELVVAALVGTLASLCAVALLGTSAWLISRASQQPPVLYLSVAAVMVRAFALGRAVFRYGERMLGHDAAFRGLTSLRVAVFERMTRLAPVGLAGANRGDLLTRLMGDVDAALDLPVRVVLPWVQASAVSLAVVAFTGWLDPSAGIVVAVVAAIGLLIAPWVVGALAARAEQRMAPAKAVLSGAVVASVQSVADLVVYDRAAQATASIAGCDAQVTTLARRSAAALGFGGVVTVALQGAAVVGSLAVAIPRVIDGTLEPVWLAAVALVPLALFEVIGTLPSSALALQRLRGSAARIAELDDIPDPVHEPTHPVPLASGFTELRLQGVSAGWSDGLPVLHDIDLQLSAGERITVVGPSGAGKSTLVAVLCGFLDYRGSVLLNGIEMRTASGDAVRSIIGVLAQRAHVFDTTIRENVSLGRACSDDDIWAALDAAAFGDAVRTMPRRLDTAVGTFGTRISGGEAQRLALARLLVDPRQVLVLDEPTEHLDQSTGRALVRTLREVQEQRATIEITHRLRDIGPGDRVVVLQAGRVAADGTASELASRPGWFADRLADERDEDELAHLVASLPLGRGVPRSR